MAMGEVASTPALWIPLFSSIMVDPKLCCRWISIAKKLSNPKPNSDQGIKFCWPELPKKFLTRLLVWTPVSRNPTVCGNKPMAAWGERLNTPE